MRLLMLGGGICKTYQVLQGNRRYHISAECYLQKYAASGKFQSISEPWANSTTHAGKMIMTVFAGIAEFERDLIRERTGAGRETARQRGVRFGRPRKLNPDQAKVASQLLSEGRAVRDIARTFNVHEATIYRLAPS